MADKLTEQIIAAAIEAHKALGPGLLESIYEEALCHEFELRQIKYERQKPVNVNYKGHAIKGQRIDLLVESDVILELKAQRKVPDIAMAQVFSYLKATGLKRALLMNFSESKLIKGIKRISL